ncbi:MAG: hypothetical protein WCS97_03785 [Candidatus Paceibacterota bacterium]|jgi:hypothetical protein
MGRINSLSDSLKVAYALLHASSPSELAQKFIQEDQVLLKTSAWDYKNPELVINKVKDIVERALHAGSTMDEQSEDDLRTILWFWYHHAIGFAIWGSKDRAKAKEFSKKALEYQTGDNPNMITRLLYLLVHNKEKEAGRWLKTILTDPDKTVSQGIWQEYKAGNFFRPQDVDKLG